MTITADDPFSVLGIGVTKHFQLVVQLFIASCTVHIHVIHADLSGIPVTGFVQVFESNINQQLAKNPYRLTERLSLLCLRRANPAECRICVLLGYAPVDERRNKHCLKSEN